jgi:hypothetical protein
MQPRLRRFAPTAALLATASLVDIAVLAQASAVARDPDPSTMMPLVIGAGATAGASMTNQGSVEAGAHRTAVLHPRLGI